MESVPPAIAVGSARKETHPLSQVVLTPSSQVHAILALIMKLALNGATTMRADLATDLQAAKEAGFDYLEIWAAKLRAFLKERSVAELDDLFSQSGLSPLSINSIEHITFRDGQAYDSIKRECEE